MRNSMIFGLNRWSSIPSFLNTIMTSTTTIIVTLLFMNVASGSDLFDDHVRSMVYLDKYYRKDFVLPVYVASFGDPLLYPKGINLMYPPIDDDGYLCSLPNSFEKLQQQEHHQQPQLNGSNSDTTGMPIGLFVKYGGNCTVQTKAEILYQIQQYFPYVDVMLVYSTTPPPQGYIHNGNEQLTVLGPETYPVSNMFDHIGILYVKYNDSITIINEITTITNWYNHSSSSSSISNSNSNSNIINHENNNQTISAYFMDHLNTTSSTANDDDTNDVKWKLNFYISGQPDYYDGRSGTSNSNGFNQNRDNDYDDGNSASFFWFRFVLFGLLILAPCFRALYLCYMGGGRIYFRRNETTGQIVGLQYIPPIASWLAIGPGRLQQPSTPFRDTISEEEFMNLPEIKYTEPLSVVGSSCSTTPKQNVDETALPMKQIVITTKSGECNSMSHAMPLSTTVPVEYNNNGEISIDGYHECETPNASFHSAVEKGIIGIENEDDNYMPNIPVNITISNNDRNSAVPESSMMLSNNNTTVTTNTTSEQPQDLMTPTTTTTTCTTCSICIEDFILGETLTCLPRCKHAFHKSCIRPWLMERQGCCPLCKTAVLPDSTIVIDPDNSIVAEDDEVEETPRNISTSVAATTTTVATPTTRRSNR